MAGSINRVVLVGNLTRDPELRATPGGTSVCSMRVAVNDRVKDPNTGEWSDKPNYFNVSVFGAQAERYAQWLTKGRQIAIDGRLRWREWQTQEGQKREAVEIVADNVQFIGPRESGESGYGTNAGFSAPGASGGAPFGRGSEPPKSDFAEAADDDIPF